MNLWNWLRSILNREGKDPPRPEAETYEGTIQIGHHALTKPLREIAKQEKRSAEEVVSDILSHAIEEYEHFDEGLSAWNLLSPREQQVAALACLEYTNQGIAQKLFISPNTVKAHLRNIQQKFNVRSKAQLRQVLSGWDFRAFDDGQED